MTNFNASSFHLQRDDELCWRAPGRGDFPSHVAANIASGARDNYPQRDSLIDKKRTGMDYQSRAAASLVDE